MIRSSIDAVSFSVSIITSKQVHNRTGPLEQNRTAKRSIAPRLASGTFRESFGLYRKVRTVHRRTVRSNRAGESRLYRSPAPSIQLSKIRGSVSSFRSRHHSRSWRQSCNIQKRGHGIRTHVARTYCKSHAKGRCSTLTDL